MKTDVAKQPGIINPANIFTFARVPLTLFGVWLYLQGHEIIGVFTIAGAALTDFFDGMVARAFKCESDFGAQFDQISDKILMLIVVIFSFFQVENWYSLLVLALIVVLEFTIIFTNLRAKRLYGYNIVVSKVGKRAMFARMSAVSWLLFATAGTGNFFEFVEILGLIAGLVGFRLGGFALRGYLDQIEAQKSSKTV